MRTLVIALLFPLALWADTEAIAPNQIAAQFGYTDCSVGEIDDDPDSADSEWCDHEDPDASDISNDARVAFLTPSGDPTTGAGLQEFRVQLRKTSPSNNPTCGLHLFENGTNVTSNIISSTSISSTTGVVLNGFWDAGDLSTADGSLVEAFVFCNKGGGDPGDRAVGEMGAIEWIVDFGGAASTFLRFTSVND